ncbi:DUF721 domain-containing protein [Corynebacterium hylobatis]|uniref:DUF721 domain-containing protein n=1 Tax=Corynebacterium hylobatis TaxID=1859290 RepID=A0A430HWD8_9CORY|nr:DciA family protein [Corynebacterium hylobatis]RSZ61929.1 DUF721 domain-containing protein [Corynebacterium hylobatis]
MSEQPDPVKAAFEAMQEAAKKRGSTPLPPRKAASRSRGLPPRIGRPTGRDGRRRRRPLDVDSIGAVLGDEFSKRGWEKDIAGGWVFGHWDELVGEKIAQHTRVEMIKDKKLFIICDSTAWATNLRMMQRQILQVIAEKVGPNIIVELKIFGPRAPSWRKGPLHVKGRGPRDTYG